MNGRGVIVLVLSLGIVAAPLQSQQVAAVLSSDLGPYAEALEGFREALGDDRQVAIQRLDDSEPELPRSTRVVVTFGSKAALREYPDRATVVQCMSPAVQSNSDLDPYGGRVLVHMVPHASHLLGTILRLQPDARRLAALLIADLPSGYFEALQRSGAVLGVHVEDVRLLSTDELPDRLRGLADKGVDALWLAPDPLLINAHTFAVLKEYARANRVPFYAPTAGFVDAGAMASVAPSFRHIGAEAAAATLRLLAGLPVAHDLYPEQSETTLGPSVALRAGLLAEDFEGHVDRIVNPSNGRYR